jgi:drug/metabolite transporter (DMT)-like permease
MDMFGEKWTIWAILEGVSKTASKVLQKYTGVASSHWGDTFLATAVIGIVQLISGLIVSKTKRINLITDRYTIIGCSLFGLNAVLITVLGFAVFLYGGDMGVSTFIVSLAIIPGAIFDQSIFNHKVSKLEWLGIFIAVLGGITVLQIKSFDTILNFPLWVWMSFGMTILSALGQVITQKINKVDPFVKNFWGGLVTCVLCIPVAYFMLSNDIFSPTRLKLVYVSAIMGLIIVGMWSFNLLSYKSGASIALKKLVMFGVYLSTAMFAGVIFFHEPLTIGKIIGVILYIVAFILIDRKSKDFIKGILYRKNIV